MPEIDQPQLYLLTPPDMLLSEQAYLLAAALDAVPVACLRLRIASEDEERVLRSADAVREIAHARDVPLVIERHVGLVERLGLDGVHLTDGARSVRKTRKALGADAIIGAFCGNSKHDGLAAGEAGADYVAFGPAGVTLLGDGEPAEADLFGWWSEVVELPVVAEGALDAATIAALAPIADFFAFGDEVWQAPAPLDTLRALYRAMSGA
jgi:thiamine-phosphate pyrophosphorylase